MWKQTSLMGMKVDLYCYKIDINGFKSFEIFKKNS